MRKLAFYTMTICMLFTFSITDIKAVNTNPNTTVATKPTETEQIQVLVDRLNEIKAMDMSTLTSVEKKALRKEVRAIKQEVKAVNGIYLSIGALVIIVLLLILLL